MYNEIERVQKAFTPDSDWKASERLLGTTPIYTQLNKALEAGTGVDAAQFSGGRAMQYESLEKALLSVTLNEEDARLWRLIPKRAIAATVDQYTRRTGFGGRWGLATTESANPTAHMTEMSRAFANVKFYRDYRSITDVIMRTHNIDSPRAVEEQAGLLNIIHSINEDMYWSNGDVFPERVNGLYNALTAPRSGATIVDLNGAVLTARDPFNDAIAAVRTKGGRITNAFMNPMLGEDFSKIYSNAERVMLTPAGAGVYAGVEIAGLKSQFGKIDFELDPFAFCGWEYGRYPGGPGEADKRPGVPAAVVAEAGGSGCNDKNLPVDATGYMYLVTAVNENGESAAASIEAVVPKTAGKVITLTISDPVAGAQPTGYRIYRSGKAADVDSECRFLCQIPRTAADTDFIDDGEWVPGTAHIALLDMRPQAQTIQWSQLFPAGIKELAVNGPVHPYLICLYGAFRIAKPEWLGLIKNVLPQSVRDAGWNPV